MGNWISWSWWPFSSAPSFDARIIVRNFSFLDASCVLFLQCKQIVGLDAAGKTRLLYMLKLGKVEVTIPTIGFNVEILEVNGFRLQSWDLGGRVSSLLISRSILYLYVNSVPV